MKVITISGHAQNGKDSVAGMLVNKLESMGRRVLVTHYADLLKYICKTFFGWDGEKDENGRHILQYVGTDIIRKEAPDYWVDFIASILKYFGDNWDYVIIPDLRFPNEIEKLKTEGFDVTHLRVIRRNFVCPLTEEQQKHPSETALDDIEPDFYIFNDGSIKDLDDAVANWVNENVVGSRVILYSTGCPKCKVLKQKLLENGIQYTENNSVDDMLEMGITQVPVLSVDNELLDFAQAIQWLKQ